MRSLLFLLILLLLQSCSNNNFVIEPVRYPNEKGDTVEQTLVVYMMAENSLANYAAYDENEIKKGVAGLPAGCRVFAFVDDREFPRILQYKSGEDDILVEVVKEYETDVCSSDVAVLDETLELILENFPTRSLDLVLWSHADGWVRRDKKNSIQRSIGLDNEKNTYSNSSAIVMEMDGLANVLENLPVKVRYLIFDACFMQCIEVGYELRNSAEWIIASPAEIPANGAPYDILLPIIFDNNASPGDIINAYKVSYDNESSGVVLSAVRTSALQDFATATYGLIGKYFPTSKKRAYSDVFSYLPGGNRSSSQILPNYFDMNAIIKKYSTADEYEVWKREFDNLVAYSTASDYWYSAFLYRRIPVKHEVYGAVSIYMPQPDNIELNTAFQYTEWYKAAGWDAAGW